MKNWPLNSAFLLNIFLKVNMAALDNDPSRKHTYSAACYLLSEDHLEEQRQEEESKEQEDRFVSSREVVVVTGYLPEGR